MTLRAAYVTFHFIPRPCAQEGASIIWARWAWRATSPLASWWRSNKPTWTSAQRRSCCSSWWSAHRPSTYRTCVNKCLHSEVLLSHCVWNPRMRFSWPGSSATRTCWPLASSSAPAASCGSWHRSWPMVSRNHTSISFILWNHHTCFVFTCHSPARSLLCKCLVSRAFPITVWGFAFLSPTQNHLFSLKPSLGRTKKVSSNSNFAKKKQPQCDTFVYPFACRVCRHLTENIFPRWNEWIPDSVPAVRCAKSLGILASDGLRSPVSIRA